MNEIVVTIVCHDRVSPDGLQAIQQARLMEEAVLQAASAVLGIGIVDGIGTNGAPPQVYAGVRTTSA